MSYRNKLMAAAFAFMALILTGCADQEETQDKQEMQETKEKQDTKDTKDTKEQGENQQSMEEDITSDIPDEEFIRKASAQKIEHVHGIGYPGNDDALYVATHNGLKIYRKGEWLETAGQNHDYMGFQATEEGFFASGHPEKGSNLKDPLGLVESTDKGRTLEKIAFSGESDFHFLSAGYSNSSLYLINEEPNSKLERGVYLSRDQASSWEPVELGGLESTTLGMMAVHPDKGGTFAMATKEGVFITDDYGKNMKRAGEYELVTAAAFSKESLYISPVHQQTIQLYRLDAENTEKAENLTIPHLDHDNPITYIAADPRQEGRIAFMTILNDLYESEDGGRTWKRLLVNGRIEH
ncbi:F510_1955 family glycosylhydrolase [Mesobacillus jeotgali]|uniref:F510_1955 family glycosylhydrolase n=1 Tax=Mesobacillus jeotgali TaxID=129985 RepID=UPI00177ADF77|nr:hypothetical protein [Mesobacillus jeotgali]UYZ21335.1 hypothetical protein FOF60_20320 [Mesobacillus jeotgali]